MIVDFYRTVGYLPDALLNYLLLLGWSLDDKTEQFTRDEMIEHFSLERVNKAPASFDPQKLWAFQQRDMLALPLDEKVAADAPVCRAGRLGRRAGAGDDRSSCCGRSPRRPAIASRRPATFSTTPSSSVRRSAAGLRREGVRQAAAQGRCRPCCCGSSATSWRRWSRSTPRDTEACLRQFVEAEGIKIGEVIHALRVAVTGKAVGWACSTAWRSWAASACSVASTALSICSKIRTRSAPVRPRSRSGPVGSGPRSAEDSVGQPSGVDNVVGSTDLVDGGNWKMATPADNADSKRQIQRRGNPITTRRAMLPPPAR